MFKNLKVDMVFAGITKRELAKIIGISYNTFRAKIRGQTEWKLHEMLKIQKILNEKNHTERTIDYLFEK